VVEPVPVMVTVEVPRGVELAVAMVRVDVPVPLVTGVTEAGTKVQVAPVGKPEQLSPTAPLKLTIEVTVTVEVVDWPGTTAAGAVAARLKSGVVVTFRVREAV